MIVDKKWSILVVLGDICLPRKRGVRAKEYFIIDSFPLGYVEQ